MSRQQEWALNLFILFTSSLMFVSGFYQAPSLLEGWHLFNYSWYMLTTFCMVVVLSKIIYTSGRPTQVYFDCWMLTAVAVFIPVALLRLSYIEDISIWLDEYVQVVNTMTPFRESAIQQQPPFYYLLSTAVVDYMGSTEAWLRSTSIFFGSASILIGALFGRLINLRPSLYLLWLLALGLVPVLVRYSFEARPNIAGIYTCLLWMCTLVPPIVSGRVQRLDLIRIFFSTYIFCLTIGLQSLALPLYSIPLLLVVGLTLKKIGSFQKIAMAQIAALVAFSPILYGIVFESISRDQFQDVTSWGERIVGLLDLKWWDSAILVFELVPFYGFLLLVAASSSMYLLIKERDNKNCIASLIAYSGIIVLPFIYTSIFQVTINWEFYERYFLCYVVVFIAALFIVLNQIKILPAWWRPRPAMQVMGALLLSIGGAWYLKNKLSVSSMHNYGQDFRLVYNYINENAGKTNYVASFTAFNESGWEPNTLIAPEFYLEESEDKIFYYRPYIDKTRMRGDQVRNIAKTLSEKDVSNLFLIMAPFSLFGSHSFPSIQVSGNVQIIKFNQSEILHIKRVDRPLIGELEEYFLAWLSSGPEESYVFKIREMLFFISYFSEDLVGARKIYSEIQSSLSKEDQNQLRSMKLQAMQDLLSKKLIE